MKLGARQRLGVIHFRALEVKSGNYIGSENHRFNASLKKTWMSPPSLWRGFRPSHPLGCGGQRGPATCAAVRVFAPHGEVRHPEPLLHPDAPTKR